MVFFEGVHCDIYKSSYNILKYIILEFTPYIVLPSPILEQFQQVSFFHLYTCVHSICTVFTPHDLSPPLSPSTNTNNSPPGGTCSTLLLSDFAKEEKNDIFASLR
jgi:hypothetical protein